MIISFPPPLAGGDRKNFNYFEANFFCETLLTLNNINDIINNVVSYIKNKEKWGIV
ncbi:MAG: hypothetical protein LBR79_06550 [Oscillospiraceae bacterium]|nr:hypothetical protein [Oscillospiraceae bacterium]